MFQTQRNAKVVASVVTFVKLLAFGMKKADVSIAHKETDLLRAAAIALMTRQVPFSPVMDHLTTLNPSVDTNVLPSSARIQRKRPASALVPVAKAHTRSVNRRPANVGRAL